MAPLVHETALNGDDAVVVLEGELDLAGSAALEAEIERLATLDGVERVVLDLSRLEFMDSSGLRALLAADTRARERGARLVIVRGDERIQRVLRITRLDERLEIVDDAEAVPA